MTDLEKYYNKFKEEHRLTTRHGIVEYRTSMKYIHDFIPSGEKKSIKILDIGAGTGRYSVALAEEGYTVTAVELVKHNLDVLRAKHANVNTWQGNAMDLHFLEDETFDVTLLFGPMYHLHSFEDKCKALNEAHRVTKKGGTILVAYVMNEYSILTYCFKERHIKECVEKATITSDFHTITGEKDLYSYVRIEDIDKINNACGIERKKLIAADGASDYMRTVLNSLDEEEFNLYLKYHFSICERPDLLGASSHLVDILKV